MLNLETLTPKGPSSLRVRGASDGHECECDVCQRVTVWAPFDPDKPDNWYCIDCSFRDQPGLWWSDTHSRSICVVRLNTYADPAKSPDTPEGAIWSRDMEKSIGTKRYRREFCNDFDIGTGFAIYPNFSPADHHDEKLEFDPNYPLWMGYDWGAKHPAIVFAQGVGPDLRVLTEILGLDTPLPHFLRQAKAIMKSEFFPGWGLSKQQPDRITVESLQCGHPKRLICVGDIAGNNRNSFHVTDIAFVQQEGFQIDTRYNSPIRKIEKVQHLLEIDQAGHTRLKLRGRTYAVRGRTDAARMDSSQPGTLLQGFIGAYQFQQDSKGELRENRMGPKALKSLESHLMDALSEIVEHWLVLDDENTPRLEDIRANDNGFWDGRAKPKPRNDHYVDEELLEFLHPY